MSSVRKLFPPHAPMVHLDSPVRVQGHGVTGANVWLPDLTFDPSAAAVASPSSQKCQQHPPDVGDERQGIRILWPQGSQVEDGRVESAKKTRDGRVATDETTTESVQRPTTTVAEEPPPTAHTPRRGFSLKKSVSVKKSNPSAAAAAVMGAPHPASSSEKPSDERESKETPSLLDPSVAVAAKELKARSHSSKRRKKTDTETVVDPSVAAEEPERDVDVASESNRTKKLNDEMGAAAPAPEKKKMTLFGRRSRKERSRTLAGSEFGIPSNEFRSSATTSDVVKNVSSTTTEKDVRRVLMRGRSSSLKANPTRKGASTAFDGDRSATVDYYASPKRDDRTRVHATPTPPLTHFAISRLDGFSVLVPGLLEENADIQTVGGLNKMTGVESNVVFLMQKSKSVDLTFQPDHESVKHTCIAKAPVTLTQGSRSCGRYIFLLPDQLLIMKQKTSTIFKLTKKVDVFDLWLGSGLDGTADETTTTSSKSSSLVIGWPPATNFLVTFATVEQKLEWTSVLEKQISLEKEKILKKDTVIKITGLEKDLKWVKNLTVSKEDDVQNVIQRCLKDFIQSNPNDFELCLQVRDSLFLFRGHEYPYNIQMKKERESQVNSQDSTTSFTFDNFVLRPKKIATSKKNGQRKHRPSRLGFMGLFRRTLPSPPDVLRSTPRAMLFTRNLDEICADDRLPKPIMDLLCRLFVNGPSTVGIFRKAANYRDFLDLKARLDAGEECNMDNISIHVAAGTIKHWIRDLPDCLLVSNLYNKWIENNFISDIETKRENMKRLVAILPRHHQILLRHLVCILYHISLRSDFNQMTSSNLAICIGPTVLWAPTSGDIATQYVSVDNVTRVVQALVDDAAVILGDECLRLFDGLRKSSISSCERNSESEGSFLGSQELLMEQLNRGISHESLDPDSSDELVGNPRNFDTGHSQMSVDSGLAVSDPHLFEEDLVDSTSTAASATTTATADVSVQPDSSPVVPRFTKQPKGGGKRKSHAKSELSDISEGLGVPTEATESSEERPHSKMSFAQSVRQRIDRARATTKFFHSEDSANESSEEQWEERAFVKKRRSSSVKTRGGRGCGAMSVDVVHEYHTDTEVDGKRASETMLVGTVKPTDGGSSENRPRKATKALLFSSSSSIEEPDDDGAMEWLSEPETNLRSARRRKEATFLASSLFKMKTDFKAAPDRTDVVERADWIAENQRSTDRVARTGNAFESLHHQHEIRRSGEVVYPSRIDRSSFSPAPNESWRLAAAVQPLRPCLTGFEVLDASPRSSPSGGRPHDANGRTKTESAAEKRNDSPNAAAAAHRRNRDAPQERRRTDVNVQVSDPWFTNLDSLRKDWVPRQRGTSSVVVNDPSWDSGVARNEPERREVEGRLVPCQNRIKPQPIPGQNRNDSPLLLPRHREYGSDLSLTIKSPSSSRGRNWRQSFAESYSDEVMKDFVSQPSKKSIRETDVYGRPVRGGQEPVAFDKKVVTVVAINDGCTVISSKTETLPPSLANDTRIPAMTGNRYAEENRYRPAAEPVEQNFRGHQSKVVERSAAVSPRQWDVRAIRAKENQSLSRATGNQSFDESKGNQSRATGSQAFACPSRNAPITQPLKVQPRLQAAENQSFAEITGSHQSKNSGTHQELLISTPGNDKLVARSIAPAASARRRSLVSPVQPTRNASQLQTTKNQSFDYQAMENLNATWSVNDLRKKFDASGKKK